MTRTHADLVADLRADDAVPPAWVDVFAAVDRGAFIPARCWVDDRTGRPAPFDRVTDPDGWAAAVYSDRPIVTQLDDGATVWPDTSRNPTSSASQPSLVLAMLDALDVEPGRRVLEIGTGTGWNAALLATRLGDDHVTTVELDAELADRARRALKDAGVDPTVVTGDGTAGYPARAPFDRVISTAAVAAGRIPLPWVEQTARPGGQLLIPWRTTWGAAVLMKLIVHDGGTVIGSVAGDAYFMALRDHRAPWGHAARFGGLAEDSDLPATVTTLPPHQVAYDRDGMFAVGVQVPDVQHSVAHDDSDADVWELLLFHVDSGSWATVRTTPDATTAGRFEVRRHGPRRLWDEVETAHGWWVGQGRPSRFEFGLTVTPDDQQVWLGEPDNTVTPVHVAD
ncbi:methyltransferase domain-containing protein [Actinosynnema sp. NPDC023587]|uniref:methyltransferase domain-containing protein n=1 Tax=Actinosynnema sp. NPDC023587 TaxID=3154695 RepID=UPI0033DB1688